jgi:hypothetical protein
VERPSYISLAHWDEWVIGSRVSSELTTLNVKSLTGVTGYEYLLYASAIPRRNDRRLTDHWLKKYCHVEHGGWWCGTVLDSLWGCFKPDKPRRDKEDRKLIKYEHPPRVSTGLFALKLPLDLWQHIANRYKVAMPEGLEFYDIQGLYHLFWEWVIAHPEIPIIITEGAKKAGALLTASYVAIALPGIFNGYRQPKDETGEPTGSVGLIPHLALFATKGRPLYFAFDSDFKPKTIANVQKAISQTGWLLEQEGCQVRVIEWSPELGKGVDDLIVSHGVEAFHALYKVAKPLALWKARQLSQLTYEPNIRVNRRYLNSIPLPTNAKVIGIKAPKGTGKTELLTEWVAEATSKGQWVLVITHRIQLGEALCERFGVPYVTELKDSETGKIFGYGLCIDSLHPKSQAQFHAENWEDGLVILDEAEQVLWHMLNSSTCQSERVPILKSFKTLIQNVLTSDGQVILSDADLTDVSIDYIKELSGVSITPFIIQNDWKPSVGWKVYRYGGRSPEALVASLLTHIQEGGKPFICVSGQKCKSKWSTTTLERFLQDRFPDKRILRIDSESVSDPTHPAFCCISNLNKILLEFDIVLASPSIETGVSIDIRDHFTSVWGISHGISPVTSFLQSIARVRPNVERHIWVARRGLGRIGNGSSSIKNLLASQQKLTKANIRLLQIAGYDALDAFGGFQQESLLAWAKMATRINATMPCYNEAVVEALFAEGHTVTDVLDQDTPETLEIIQEGIDQTRGCNLALHRQGISEVTSINEKEYLALKEKRAKTHSERQQERKYSLESRYGINVSPLLVAMDDKGFYLKLRLHYFLLLGREYLSDRDKRAAQAQVDAGCGDVWQPDFNSSQMGLRVTALDYLGVTPLLSQAGRELRNSDPDVQAIARKALVNAWELQAILGLSIGKNEAPIRILGRLLGQVGAGLTCVSRKGSRESRERVYQLHLPDDGRYEIFSVWLERDKAKKDGAVSVSTSLIDQINTQLVDEGQRATPQQEPDDLLPQGQAEEVAAPDESPPRDRIPVVGSLVRWFGKGAEKLVVLAADVAGQLQVRSLLSGLVFNTSVSQVEPV